MSFSSYTIALLPGRTINCELCGHSSLIDERGYWEIRLKFLGPEAADVTKPLFVSLGAFRCKGCGSRDPATKVVHVPIRNLVGEVELNGPLDSEAHFLDQSELISSDEEDGDTRAHTVDIIGKHLGFKREPLRERLRDPSLGGGLETAETLSPFSNIDLIRSEEDGWLYDD